MKNFGVRGLGVVGVLVALSAASALMSGAAFAGGETSCGNGRPQDRPGRILSDPVLVATVNAVEKKYETGCAQLQENLISWRCLNGPQCGYVIKIPCSQPGGYPDAGQPSLLIQVTGYDDGAVNDVQRIEFLFSR